MTEFEKEVSKYVKTIKQSTSASSDNVSVLPQNYYITLSDLTIGLFVKNCGHMIPKIKLFFGPKHKLLCVFISIVCAL